MLTVVISTAETRLAGGPLAGQPAGNSRDTWHERRGVLLRLTDDEGRVGVGEASPLPGYSPDSLDECVAALTRLDLPHTPVEAGQVPSIVAAIPYPAARFAVETALFDLLGQKSTRPIASFLSMADDSTDGSSDSSSDSARQIPLNAMISDLSSAEEAVEDAYARGIRSVKFKIGRSGRITDEIALLRVIRANYGHSLEIRLDANRAWSTDEARSQLRRLAEFDAAYIEEPGSELTALVPSPVPLAADESLALRSATRRQAVKQLLHQGHLRALILKPMLLGGMIACAEWALLARQHGTVAVISHLLGGPVELAACAQLALAVGGTHACGLDRHPGLSAWPRVPVTTVGADRVVATGAPGLGIDASARAGLEE